jgi:hypothetical protein
MPVTKKPAPAKKKNAAPPVPIESTIVTAVRKALEKNPKKAAQAAAIAAIKEMQKRSALATVQQFLARMLAEVKAGGGQDGGAGASNDGPPPERTGS